MQTWIAACLLVLLTFLSAVPTLADDNADRSALADDHRLLLDAAVDLSESVIEQIWPGWGGQPFEILLIAGERELLIGGPRLPAGFETEEAASALGLGSIATRPRVFPPGLLATMPIFGPPPTIVVGTPEATERRSTEWLLVLLHEHFHQWQMREASYYRETEALDLAAGDTTGRWMLDYPFPYDDEEIGRAFAGLSRQLAGVLTGSSPSDPMAVAPEVWRRYSLLLDILEPADARYLEFQLWQEGVARFVELRVAEQAAASWTPPTALSSLPDFEGLDSVAHTARERLIEELERPDLADRRRVSFYALGAGLALLLDRTEPGWKRRYEAPRFALAPPAD